MNKAKPIKLIVCWLAAIAILAPAAAWAETDCQVTPLKMPLGNAGTVCTLEIATGVGALVWEIRRNKDGYVCGDVAGYCIKYSLHCPHYAWQQGCLRRELNKTKYPHQNCFK